MRRWSKLVWVPMFMVGAVSAARAADVPITGLKLIVVDKVASSGQAKAVFVSKDAGVTKGPGTDATQIAAILDVTYDSVSGAFDMPQGAGWLVNSDNVAKYVNKDAPTGGAVKVSAIKPGSLVKVVGKSLGDVPLDISVAPTGSVYVADTIVNGPDTTRLCTQFDACTHKVVAGGSGYKLVCKGSSTGDGDCTAAPPTSTTSTTLPDPCTINNGDCDPLTSCVNDEGSPLCGPCPGGYTGTGATACTDVNECATNNGGCSAVPPVTCTNSPGSSSCGPCPSGYTGSGVTCTDINECATNNGGCSAVPPVTCTNSPGSSSCGPCPSGYTGSGVTCTDINECATNNGGCSVLASCANTAGSRTCTCPAGCAGDGFTCTDTNECAINNGGCGIGVTCTNTPSCSFTCTP